MATGNSFTAMVSQIVFELGQRTDLQATVVPRAINDAIQIYQKERFRFNELQPLAPFTFNTVVGQAYYGVAADARIPQLYKIDYLNYVLGGEIYKIWRASSPEEVYLANQAGATQTGQPELWAYDGDTIVFYPYPNVVYPITVGGYLAVAGPGGTADPSTTNPWMNAAERLIRSRAKYEIALHVTRNAKMQDEMSPLNPGDTGKPPGAAWVAYNELKAEANKIRGTSRVRAMPF
jgi:hypothetical protein